MSLIVDRTNWGRLAVTGSDRVRFLQGLTTVNVAALADDQHQWGAILSPKGRVLSVIHIAHRSDQLVVACEPSLTDPTRALLERYAVMDDVQFAPVTRPAYQEWSDPATVWAQPIVDGHCANALPDIDPTVERLRIRAGFLRYGIDVDDQHFPFETPLAALLDYNKGCYVGQEPVFRVHAQGNAAKALRGFVVSGAAPVPRGSAIKHPAKDAAGTITSSVAGDDGTTWALGYVHRSAWELVPVIVDGRAATMHELPW